MSDFKNKISQIVAKIKDTSHQGNERLLQEAVLSELRAASDIFYFSTGHSLNNCSSNITGYGLELGFNLNNNGKSCNRFVDIALATTSTANNNPSSVTNLCEIKIIEPRKYTFKGRWYPYFYEYGCYPAAFNFIQNNDKFNNFVTDADEGQIIFDFIKMMACRQMINSEAEMYQILAIKKPEDVTNDLFDFKWCKDKLISVLGEWKKHCNVKHSQPLEIYKWEDFVTMNHGNQKVDITCTLTGITGCGIIDLGFYGSYQHILIDWQPSEFDWEF